MRDSAAALLRVIDDVLDISKLEAGRMELDPVDFDLAETIEATVALLAPRAREKGIEPDHAYRDRRLASASTPMPSGCARSCSICSATPSSSPSAAASRWR